jgi:glucokinase
MIVVGVDIGGTKIATGAYRWTRAELLGPIATAHDSSRREATPEEFLATVGQQVGKVLKGIGWSAANDDFCGIGIGCCGIIDTDLGLLVLANAFDKVRRFAIAPAMFHFFRRAGRGGQFVVTLENDANAAGYGEALYGAGAGARVVVYVTISTGIGGAVIADGVLFRGATGAAGEFGSLHFVEGEVNADDMKKSVWGKVASGSAIAAQARIHGGASPVLTVLSSAGPGNLSAQTVAMCARRGDSVSRRLFEKAGESIGVGMSSIISLYNPDRIVIGGSLAKAWDLWAPTMRRVVSFKHPDTAPDLFCTSKGGDHVGTRGAAAVCVERIRMGQRVAASSDGQAT